MMPQVATTMPRHTSKPAGLTACLSFLFLSAVASPLARTQDLVSKADRQRAPVMIRDATIYTVSGAVLEHAALEFVDGRITRVLTQAETVEEVALIPGSIIIDGAGLALYPGFVAANTRLGLVEIDAVDMTLDLREAGSLKPEVRAIASINPDSTLFPVARRNGVLLSATLPQGGLVPGRACVLRLDGWTWQDMAVVENAGMVVNWPFMGSRGGRRGFGRHGGGGAGGSAERSLAILADLVEQSKAYAQARAADPNLGTDLRLEAMAPYVAGEKPLYINANSLTQIETALRWCKDRNLKMLLFGGREAALCLDLLAENEVTVVVGGSHRLPSRRDAAVDSSYRLPGLLEAAGVRWCMSNPGEASNARNLPYEAAACIAYGLDPAIALRSITLSAAEALGIAADYGSLEVGKSATLFLADGDPFELSTTLLAAFIDGRKIQLRDKQTALDAKYREKYRQLGLLEEED